MPTMKAYTHRIFGLVDDNGIQETEESRTVIVTEMPCECTIDLKALLVHL